MRKVFRILVHLARTLVKSVYRKTNFLISQPKHMLWVLKRTVSIHYSAVNNISVPDMPKQKAPGSALPMQWFVSQNALPETAQD